ncbi:MAG: CPBP family intramembrane metalloprotease [Thaumarchaeota archaeon]|nr:CPBP family intramembrane metalloprotease [Nitrososphaerota archaeon]
MKGLAVVEVFSVFILSYLFGWLFLTDLVRAEIAILGWSYIGGILLILIPVIILLLAKRDFGRYGFTLKEWRYNLSVGMSCYLIRLIPFSLLLLLFYLHISYMGIVGGLVLAVGEIPAIFLILLTLRRSPDEKKSALTDGLILVFLLFLPILVGLYLNKLTPNVVSTVIWQFFFSGFGEEIRYRGYYQSRINEEFGRPYSFLGVNFGIGLILASLLFAIAHVLNPFNPFKGSFDLAWGWGLWTFFAGLFFGFVREKTGSIIAAGIAHGLPDAVGEAFARLFSLM